MNEEYKKKYFKYKTKYLNLSKNINNNFNDNIINNINNINNIDGDEINIISFTHGERIKCVINIFFSDFINTIYDNYIDNKNNNINDVGFKNCSILKLSLDHDFITLDLLYDGSIFEKSKMRSHYYSNKKYNLGDDILFPILSSQSFANNNFDLIHMSKAKKINIFLVRHAESEHNIKGSLHQTVDTSITNDGIKQAYEAGVFIKNNYPNINFSYCFCSYLKRTRETSKYFFEGLQKFPKEIIILPCSNEKIFKKGCCDDDAFLQSNLYEFGVNLAEKINLFKENVPFCIKNNEIQNNNDYLCNFITIFNKNVPINWSLMIDFNKNNRHCKDTNMIKEICRIISTHKNNNLEII